MVKYDSKLYEQMLYFLTSPESLMKMVSIQILKSFHDFVVIVSHWSFPCQFSKKVIQTVSHHCWNRKCPAKWRFSWIFCYRYKICILCRWGTKSTNTWANCDLTTRKYKVYLCIPYTKWIHVCIILYVLRFIQYNKPR